MAQTTFSGPVASTNGFDGVVGGTTPAAGSFTTLTTTGTVTIDGTTVVLSDLPTSDPSVAGQLWVDGAANNVLKVSAGD